MCPTDQWGFFRMSLHTLGRWLIKLAESHPRALQVDGRTIIRSYLRRLKLDRIRLYAYLNKHVQRSRRILNRHHSHHARDSELVVDGMALSLVMGPVSPQHRVSTRPTREPGPRGHGPESYPLGSFRGLQYVVASPHPSLDRPDHHL